MVVAWSHSASAQGSPTTDAERLYRDIRDSGDREIQPLGQRWYGLVKRQEWTDDSGKFTATARYVAHDPDLRWVTLRVERVVDGQRQYKDMNIPVERLNKACQSRVRQIAHLEPRVVEALESAGEEEEEDDEAGDHRGDRRRGRPERDEADERDDEPDEPATPDSWRTSYGGFLANFTVRHRGESYQVDWGTLVPLQQVHDSLYDQDGNAVVPGPLQAVGLVAQLAAVGEFTWEAELTEVPGDGSNWAECLDLPPLPEPLSLELVLAPGGSDGQRLRRGGRVSVTGHFVAFAGRYKMVAEIHVSRPRRSSR